ncbi:MAG TPA: HAMP domain-containing sensor histidine kinase, partial [Pseudonocardiaceae bacterium]|nr:HAMP domain-containing sensor histidine kinase [Pseudonocardiaceae bacterium]
DGRVLGVPAQRTANTAAAARCIPSRTETPDGVEILVPTGKTPETRQCRTVVRVLATNEVLRGDAAKIVFLLITLSAAVVLLGIMLATRLARGLLQSVRDLANVADRMVGGDLNTRITPDGPEEIRRVGAQLNRMAIRVDHLVDEQRRHAADLAHRLRTPLTSLRLDIDALPSDEAARRLVHDHDAVTRALDEVIRAARRTASASITQSADLRAVLNERVEFWSVLAEDTARTIDCDPGPEALPVRADQQALAAMLDALLGNIFAHTPDGVSIQLSARRAGGDVRLTVDDGGPGFPDPRVIERGRSNGASTGLGLDIVRRTAEESGGRIRLDSSPAGGARVEIMLGVSEE